MKSKFTQPHNYIMFTKIDKSALQLVAEMRSAANKLEKSILAKVSTPATPQKVCPGAPKKSSKFVAPMNKNGKTRCKSCAKKGDYCWRHIPEDVKSELAFLSESEPESEPESEESEEESEAEEPESKTWPATTKKGLPCGLCKRRGKGKFCHHHRK